jgi:hypothetical protein
MTYLVLDTETINVEKPFCYDFSYIVYDTEKGSIKERSYLIKEVYENKPLFELAFFKQNETFYIQDKTPIKSWKKVMKIFEKDLSDYKITEIFGYDIDFDRRVILFNCNFFKVNADLNFINFRDIAGFACNYIFNRPDYLKLATKLNLFTKSGFLSTNADSALKFLKAWEYNEKHTALQDCRDENDILRYCVLTCGADINKNYKVTRNIQSEVLKQFNVFVNGNKQLTINYLTKRVEENCIRFTFPKLADVPPFTNKM